MKSPHIPEMDFDSYKKLKDFQGKISKKKKRKGLKSLYIFITNHKKGFGISFTVIVLVLILSLSVLYPLYVKNFAQSIKNDYVELQKIEDENLKKTFDDVLQLQSITTNDLNDVQKKTNTFQTDIDNICRKSPIAIFTVASLNNSFKKYCTELKNSVLYVYELIQTEVMIGSFQTYYQTISEVTSKSSTFSSIKTEYDTLVKSTKTNTLSYKFTNTNLLELQKSTVSLLIKIEDAYNELIAAPAISSSTDGSSNAETKYKKILSDNAKPWSESIPTYIQKVTTDIETNTQISANEFLTELNKFSTDNQFDFLNKKQNFLLDVK